MPSSLLPPSATAQERAIDLSTARVGEVPVHVNDTWDPDACPLSLLPWLAWALQVDAWDSAWTEVQKRAAIKSSFKIHKLKGTVFAVKSALGSFGWPTDITEWFDTAGDPFTFHVKVYASIFDDQSAVIAKVQEILDRTKNVRSSPTIEVQTATSGFVYIACAVVDRDVLTVG